MVNGSFSRWIEVLSGIPQGSVLGSVVFVPFINDLPDSVKSNIYLFAHDANIFQEIASRNDQDQLQQDLNSLQEWETKWLQQPVNNNNTRGHQKKLYKEQSKTQIRQSQFRLRVVDTWNSLPEWIYVVEDQFWADQPIRFDHDVADNNHPHSWKT